MNEHFTLIRVSRSDRTAIVTCLPHGLCEVNQIRLWNDEIGDILNTLTAGDRLVIDFGPVLILSSFAIQKLIHMNNFAAEKKILFGLCDMDRQVQQVFEMANLGPHFMVGTTVADTLQLLSPESEGEEKEQL